MKILVFTDLHASKEAIEKLKGKIEKRKPEIIISCGDITVFEQNMDAVIGQVCALGPPVYMIHGNHEIDKNMKRSCAKFDNCKFFHATFFEYKGVLFLGWGGGGFSRRDKPFETFIKKHSARIAKAKHVVLVTHAPPYGTKLDDLYDDHVGCESFTDFVKKNANVRLLLCGHIHETAGVMDRLGKCDLLNAGPFGKTINIENS